jgi:Undecaprenyl-phosphate glucose phosphotransferase
VETRFGMALAIPPIFTFDVVLPGHTADRGQMTVRDIPVEQRTPDAAFGEFSRTIKSRPVLLREPLFRELIRLGDLFLVLAAALIAFLLYRPFAEDFLSWDSEHYIIPALLASLLFVSLMSQLGGYDLKRLRQPRWQAPRLIGVWFLVISICLIAAFFAKTSSADSRLWTFSWTVLALGLILSQRAALSLILHALGREVFKRKVVIIGTGEALERVVTKLRTLSDEISIYGVFNDRPFQNLPQSCDFSVSGNIDDLLRVAQHVDIDQVIVAVPLGANPRIKTLVDKLRQLPLEVLISVELIGQAFPILSLRHIGDLPTLEVVRPPIKHWGIIVKWIEDKLLALFILVLTAPLMVMVAALIKWDSPGPVFFAQERFGFNNKIIKVLKFRTMYVHAEDRSGARRTVEGDPRVTCIGRILRALSIDELPQVLNVLKGEMSLVGPRPHAVAMKVGDSLYCDAVGEYAQRHRVKPGITGWAQINGLRGEVNSLEGGHARVEYDLYYIERWSLWFDLKILAVTLPAVLSRRNAF